MAGDRDEPSDEGAPSDPSASPDPEDDALPQAGEPAAADQDPDGEASDAGTDEPATEGTPDVDDEAADGSADPSPDDGDTADEPERAPTCAGTTKAGEPCGRLVREPGDYCYLHADQADGTDEGTAADDPDEETALEPAEPAAPVLETDPVTGTAVEPFEPPSGPPDDQEMPLADHIEEMLKRLAIVIAVAGVVSLVTFPFAEHLINFIWNGTLPAGQLTRPRLYGILELKLTELKVASLVGIIVALPVLVFETYQFMKPGLYPHERRYYLAAIPTSLVLALIGVSFAYFVVLPTIFTYFFYYTQGVALVGFALGRTFDLILLLMGYLALVFQIPLFIMLAMMMGLVTRRWLAQRRLLFWGAFLGISFIFSPDPTGMAPVVIAVTMIALFEGTMLLTRWTARGRPTRRERSAQQ